MTDNEIIKLGDVCTYAYLDKNKSLSIVEVVKELSEEVAVVKFHQVISDDSGNGYFTYLCNTGESIEGERCMSNITWCLFCAHSNTNRRSGDQIRCIKKHKYVSEHSTCKEYQDNSFKKLTELVFKEKENG